MTVTFPIDTATTWSVRPKFSVLPGAALAAVVAALILFARPNAAESQMSPAQTSGGVKTVLPVVPRQQPRPAQGDSPKENWQTERPAKENAPTASFIESLKGNDAALHVMVGQGQLLTTRTAIANEHGDAVIAVGDPTIVDFQVMPNPRMIRVVGRRAGVTDISITTVEGQVFNFEVHVGYDLDLLRAQLQQIFPDARIKLGQVRDHLVVEGQARSAAQVTQILETLRAYLSSLHGTGKNHSAPNSAPSPPDAVGGRDRQVDGAAGRGALPEGSDGYRLSVRRERIDVESSTIAPQIINLLRVPGPQQVMLQVRVAELNRTGLREIGADLAYFNPKNGNIAATTISNAALDATQMITGGGLANGSKTTAFGVFPTANFAFFLRALQENSLLTILAEPNLVAMNGHRASFLAGGQFPIPVPQGGGGLTNNVTIEFKDFGVQLDFVPVILDDGSIRLEVSPEVSSIDFALGTTLVQGGSPVPGLNTRKTTTTVEIREGETLAIAGLLHVQIDAKTSRIPGLGDIPYIGPMFSNTTHNRQEKELLILVSPQLVSSIPSDQVGPGPGMEIQDPNCLEFYFLNRIEGRTGRPFRSTTAWDDAQVRMLHLEHSNVCGPVGFSE